MNRVLSSPDLVEQILAQLRTPCLELDYHRVRYTDRWSAAQVNQLWRKIALRMPWGAEWGNDSGKAGSQDLDILHIRRNLQAIVLWWLREDRQETLAQCALLVGCASSLSSLRVEFDTESTLLQWLQHPQVPLRDAAAPAEGLPASRSVLASLSSLRRLELRAHETRPWRDVSWLTALQRLTEVKLSHYEGPPLAGLPQLQTLQLENYLAEVALEQWASPRLTSFNMTQCDVSMGAPKSSHPMQEPCVKSPGPKDLLRGLKQLGLRQCQVNQQSLGLRELAPALTSLHVDDPDIEHSRNLDTVLSKGLPTCLLTLNLRCHASSQPGRLWPAISELSSLVSLGVLERKGDFCMDSFEAATECILSLPKLKCATLGFGVILGEGLQERVWDIQSLLGARGVTLTMSPPARFLRPVLEHEGLALEGSARLQEG